MHYGVDVIYDGFIPAFLAFLYRGDTVLQLHYTLLSVCTPRLQHYSLVSTRDFGQYRLSVAALLRHAVRPEASADGSCILSPM
jgi:hypothetical protein